MRTLKYLVGPLLVVACGIGPVEGEAPDPGAPARLVLSLSGGLAGLADTTVIDSTSATLVRTTCVTVRGAPNPCAGGTVVRRVKLTGSEARSLFGATQAAEFRRLAAQYDMSGTFVDGPEYNLRITTSSRTRNIRWSDAPGVPAVLTRFVDGIQTRTSDN